jgi:hypothetical protein
MIRLPSRRCDLSNSEFERKRQLECLRLASDLKQLAGSTPNRDLQLHYLRMATVWTDQVENAVKPQMQSILHH